MAGVARLLASALLLRCFVFAAGEPSARVTPARTLSVHSLHIGSVCLSSVGGVEMCSYFLRVFLSAVRVVDGQTGLVGAEHVH